MTCTVLLAVVSLGACNGLWGDDEMERYYQRSDQIALSAGDAKQANAVAQTIHPWPRGVFDRRIVYEAQKTQGAIVRYRSGNQPRDPLPAIGLAAGLPMGVAGATGAAVDAGGSVSLGNGIPVGPGPGSRQ